MLGDDSHTEAARCATDAAAVDIAPANDDESGGAPIAKARIETDAVCSDVRHGSTDMARTDLAANEEAAFDAVTATAADNHTVTVRLMIPTMFTTAHGRPICVREERVVSRDSAEWALWCHTRGRAAASAGTGLYVNEAPSTTTTDSPDLDGANDQGFNWDLYLPHFQPPWRQRHADTSPPPRQCTGRCHENPAFKATTARSKRERSWPSHEGSPAGEGDTVSVSLRTRYSGFTRADGSMIFLH